MNDVWGFGLLRLVGAAANLSLQSYIWSDSGRLMQCLYSLIQPDGFLSLHVPSSRQCGSTYDERAQVRRHPPRLCGAVALCMHTARVDAGRHCLGNQRIWQKCVFRVTSLILMRGKNTSTKGQNGPKITTASNKMNDKLQTLRVQNDLPPNVSYRNHTGGIMDLCAGKLRVISRRSGTVCFRVYNVLWETT